MLKAMSVIVAAEERSSYNISSKSKRVYYYIVE